MKRLFQVEPLRTRLMFHQLILNREARRHESKRRKCQGGGRSRFLLVVRVPELEQAPGPGDCSSSEHLDFAKFYESSVAHMPGFSHCLCVRGPPRPSRTIPKGSPAIGQRSGDHVPSFSAPLKFERRVRVASMHQCTASRVPRR